RKYTPATVVLDAPAVYPDWQPRNSEPWFEGPVRLRLALARSINSVAVRVIEDLGPSNVASFAEKLGITTLTEEARDQYALALGVSEVKLIELTNAYASFAGGGYWTEPRLIRSTEAPSGKRLYPRTALPRNVLTAAEGYVIPSMLTSVVKEGTGASAKKLGRP